MLIRNTFNVSSCFQFKNKNLIVVIALIQLAEKNNLNQPLLLMIQQTRERLYQKRRNDS
jgi:hypothetical protein